MRLVCTRGVGVFVSTIYVQLLTRWKVHDWMDAIFVYADMSSRIVCSADLAVVAEQAPRLHLIGTLSAFTLKNLLLVGSFIACLSIMTTMGCAVYDLSPSRAPPPRLAIHMRPHDVPPS